jgi:two-component sensor histidine kinase
MNDAQNQPTSRTAAVLPEEHAAHIPPKALGGSLRLAFALVPIVATVIFGFFDWRALESAANREALANVALVRQYSLRLVESQELLLRSAQGAISELKALPDRDFRAHRFLASLDEGMKEVARLSLVAPNGDFLLSSKQFPAQGNIGYRDYINEPLKGNEPFVDRLVVQPENRDVLIVSRASSDQAVPGVWNSAIDIAVVTEFLQHVSPEAQNAASLLRQDGKVLARHVSSAETVILGPDHPAMQGIARANSGTYVANSRTDGVRRYYAYARVGDLPVFAVAGVAKSGVLSAWFLQTALFGAVLGSLSVVLSQLAEFRRAAEVHHLQQSYERSLREAAEKTANLRATMLRELHHRVKNSLSMISGLIKLERRRVGGPDLETVNARVLALGRIYDLLHQSEDNRSIDLWILIRDICTSGGLAMPERGITIAAAGASLSVAEKFASPIALTLIELVTNAQKHAFGEAGGRIDVTLEAHEATAMLHVQDNGRGMPVDRSRSSGLRIVEALISQIDGQLHINSGNGGTKVTIAFPIAD